MTATSRLFRPVRTLAAAGGIRGRCRAQSSEMNMQRAGAIQPAMCLFRLAPGSFASLLLLVATLAGGPASADVLEVGRDGTVIVRAGLTSTAADQSSPDDVDLDAEPAVLSVVPDVPVPALTLVGAPVTPSAFQPAVLAAAQRYQVSPDLLAALVWQESRWQPSALSPKGAMGLAQLMPATARALAVDPRDAAANLAGAAHYLRQMLDLFDGDVERALAAYNAGPERVLKAGGVPAIPETRAYVSRIIDRLAATRAGVSTGVLQP